MQLYFIFVADDYSFSLDKLYYYIIIIIIIIIF